MTNEEALAILDTIPTIGEQVDALEMAIEALQKQVPLTPIKKYVCSGWVQAMCPACNNVVYDSEMSDAFNVARYREWCIYCGQHFTMPVKRIGFWAKMEVDNEKDDKNCS